MHPLALQESFVRSCNNVSPSCMPPVRRSLREARMLHEASVWSDAECVAYLDVVTANCAVPGSGECCAALTDFNDHSCWCSAAAVKQGGWTHRTTTGAVIMHKRIY